MLQLTREERLIKLEGLHNTRDLGGYETKNGYYTRVKRYIRSSSPCNLSQETINALISYGIEVVVDLRSEYEKKHQPNSLKNNKHIIYEEVDLLSFSDMDTLPQNIKDYKTLADFYIFMIEANKKSFKQLFEVFYQNLDKPILFNCSAGKDRTGVVSLLLMDLAACYDYDMVKDYSESYENNIEMMKKLEEVVDDKTKEYLGSNPRHIMIFMDYLYENYGSAKEYLINCGVDEEKLQDLIDSFVF